MNVQLSTKYRLLIDGDFVPGEAGMRPVVNPANGQAQGRKSIE